MSEEQTSPKPNWLDYARALIKLRAFRPLPSLLLLLVLLPLLPASAWQNPMTTRRTMSIAELALALTCAGTLLYWLTLYLSHVGLLSFRSNRSFGMREASESELALADLATRALCLLMAYAGPVVLILLCW